MTLSTYLSAFIPGCWHHRPGPPITPGWLFPLAGAVCCWSPRPSANIFNSKTELIKKKCKARYGCIYTSEIEAGGLYVWSQPGLSCVISTVVLSIVSELCHLCLMGTHTSGLFHRLKSRNRTQQSSPRNVCDEISAADGAHQGLYFQGPPSAWLDSDRFLQWDMGGHGCNPIMPRRQR